MIGIYLEALKRAGVYGKAFEKALLELDEACRDHPEFCDVYNGEFREALEMVRALKEKR